MSQDDKCLTHPEFLPTEEMVAGRAQEYYLLAAHEEPGDPGLPLYDVFLRRLALPMVVYSARARREITLPTLDSVHRWASTEFCQYEIGSL